MISAVVRHGGGGIEDVERLLHAFREMVNYAIERGLEKGYSLKNFMPNATGCSGRSTISTRTSFRRRTGWRSRSSRAGKLEAAGVETGTKADLS